jgi:TatD DNase family protein
MNFIDTHTHLFLEEFDSDRTLVITDAIQNGISKFILPNVDSTTLDKLLNTCRFNPSCLLPALGLHPCSVKPDFKVELNKLKKSFDHNTFYAIGEIGIDLYWDKTYINEQVEALKEQISWALEFDLPVILHCRESFDMVFDIVKNYKGLKGVFHAFTGNAEQAKAIADIGFSIGIGGIVTYKNSGLDKAVSFLSLKNIVLETDSPYLPPVPHRGKRNEPSYIIHIAKKLADLCNLSIDEIAGVTTMNAKELFKLT